MDATTQVSSQSIIRKVERDFKVPDTGWHEDAKEWVHDALAEIGTPYVLVHTNKTLTVSDGKIKMPCILDLFIGIEYNSYMLTRIDKTIKTLNGIMDTKYEIKYPYIHLDFIDGVEVIAHYKTFPVDCDGFPLIPNMQSVRNAVTWKLMVMLIQGGMYQHPVIDYKTAFDMYENKYKGLATNDLQTPSPDETDAISNSWRTIGVDFNTRQRIYES